MKISENWLREWVNPPVSTEELATQLTMAGLEVDSVEPAAADFEGVLVGHVLKVEPHPDADKLRVCQVDVGQGEALNIVCGAPNVHEGMRAPTAVVGARLPGDFKIKKAKLRGVPSFGMLCSAKELGMAEASEGLLPLPSDAPVGADVRSYLGLDDQVIEVDLTPNRGDCLGIAGVAREIGVLNRVPVTAVSADLVPPSCDATFPVALESPEDCPRYLGRVIRGIDAAAETPLWMQERLRRGGIRSLGPLVDVTNYVMLELGQPMHAFDLGRLEGGIEVRRARAGDVLTLLDGREVKPDADTLLIADGAKPLALAGIMGGEFSGVNDDTRDLFLECAWFNPLSIAGRARRYGLQTDASYRFERGVDPELAPRAMERATRLLLDIVGGEPGPVSDSVLPEHLPVRAPVTLRAARLARVLGAGIPDAEVEDILQRLGMHVVAAAGEWRITPPGFRFDVSIEADLIEEVGRVYGYNRLPTRRIGGALDMGARPEGSLAGDRLRNLLVDRGYQEVVTYSFVDPELQTLLDPEADGIALANPISADMAVMRTTLWPGLLQALVYNLKRQQERVRLFESGLKFINQHHELKQIKCISAAMTGAVDPEQWDRPSRAADFFDLKGDLEALLDLTGRPDHFIFEPARHPALHPGQCARIEYDQKTVGWIGALNPEVVRKLGVSEDILLFELEMQPLTQRAVPSFRGLSRFPSIRRDLAVVVDESVSALALRQCIEATLPELLQELRLFDVYRGKGVDSRRKSIAFGLILQDSSRTLTDEEVDAAMERVTARLQEELGASLRD
jgi:phenylalanyl-tRNA synthetase beta chain